MNIAIIPARGGSKRIPGKNIRPFCGRPMIAWPIEAALRSGLFDEILVSTDSERIAQTAREWGASAPFLRPETLSGDLVGTEPVLEHALRWIKDSGREPTYACCIYPTAPLLEADALASGLEVMRATGCSCCFSVTTFTSPIFRALRVGNTGALEMIWPENENKRSQDLPEAYHDAGQFYWVDPERFLASPRLYAADARPVVLPRWQVQDIDTEEDWTVAERIFRARGGE